MKMIYERGKIANVKYEFNEGHIFSDNSTFHLVMDECRRKEFKWYAEGWLRWTPVLIDGNRKGKSKEKFHKKCEQIKANCKQLTF